MDTLNNVVNFLATYSVITLSSMVSIALRVWVVIEVIKVTSILNLIKL
jgi:hypothetical protein